MYECVSVKNLMLNIKFDDQLPKIAKLLPVPLK